jgi:putative tryptophan/tyrosine transport system substrate-binding protein
VGAGLVASLARPGGNVTGLANMNTALGGKRLELVTQVVPGLQRVALFWDPRANVSSVQELQAAAQTLGLQLLLFEIREITELEGTFDAASAQHVDGLLIAGANLTRSRQHIVSLAARHRLPTLYPDGQAVREGGLMSYGAHLLELHRRAATYVDRILKGTKPADLPVEQPMTFEFVVNLKTAQALGITFPNEIMLQVTEVVQ